MDTKYYRNLVNYAKACLPPNSTLDPRELVHEAFLAVNTTDKKLLTKAISSTSYKYRRDPSLYFVPLEKAGYKHIGLRKYTQVCKACGHELGLNHFTLYTFEHSPRQYYAATCITCQSKKARATAKQKALTDPAYREKKLQTKREWKRKNYDPEKRRQEWAKIKADPVRLEDFYRRQREGRAKKK